MTETHSTICLNCYLIDDPPHLIVPVIVSCDAKIWDLSDAFAKVYREKGHGEVTVQALYQVDCPDDDLSPTLGEPLRTNRRVIRSWPNANELDEERVQVFIHANVKRLVTISRPDDTLGGKRVFDFVQAPIKRRRLALPESATIYQTEDETEQPTRSLLPTQGGFREIYSQPGMIAADKTHYIELLDETPQWYYVFLRPRRWGKTTFLQMLASYYDKRNKPHFLNLFGDLYIGKKPTSARTSLLVLCFDFSSILGDTYKLRFHDHVNQVLRDFLVDNFDFLRPITNQDMINEANGTASLLNVLNLVEHRGQRLFVGVDEYDAPANNLLFERNGDRDSYLALAGFFYTQFFVVIKQASTTVVNKYWVTGVLPVFRDGVSPLNAVMHISHSPKFHGLCGLTDLEVKTITGAYLPHFQPHEIEVALGDLRRWCNGYRFHNDKKSSLPPDTLYNPELVFTHLRGLAKKEMTIRPLEEITAIHTSKLLDAIPNEGTASFIDFFYSVQSRRLEAKVAPSLGVDEAQQRGEDPSVTRSLLYYFGVLTYAADGKYLVVPNVTMMNVVFRRFRRFLQAVEGPILGDAKLAYTAFIVKELDPLVRLVENFWNRRPIQAVFQSDEHTLRTTLEALWHDLTCIPELRLQVDHRVPYGDGRYGSVDLFIPAVDSVHCLELKNCSIEQLWYGEHGVKPHLDSEETYTGLRRCIKNETEDELLKRKFTFRNHQKNSWETKTIESLKMDAVCQINRYLEVVKSGEADATSSGVADPRIQCSPGMATLTGLTPSDWHPILRSPASAKREVTEFWRNANPEFSLGLQTLTLVKRQVAHAPGIDQKPWLENSHFLDAMYQNHQSEPFLPANLSFDLEPESISEIEPTPADSGEIIASFKSARQATSQTWYELVRWVAEGAFGDIWKGQLCNGTLVAVKVLRFGLMAAGGGKNLKRMMREIYAWSKLDHENVHRLLGVTMIEGQLGMVSRWMAQGNLRDYLDHNKNLGRHEMVHGDIKASNILVSSDGVLKFTDFDHSLIADCSLRFTDTTRMGGGTPRWMAPELFAETSHQRSKKTDIYALGMTFLEVITGAPPYFPQCNNDIQVMFKVVQQIIPDRSLEYFPENRRGNEMWKLLTRCWEYDPVSRPPAQEVLKSIPSPSLL